MAINGLTTITDVGLYIWRWYDQSQPVRTSALHSFIHSSLMGFQGYLQSCMLELGKKTKDFSFRNCKVARKLPWANPHSENNDKLWAKQKKQLLEWAGEQSAAGRNEGIGPLKEENHTEWNPHLLVFPWGYSPVHWGVRIPLRVPRVARHWRSRFWEISPKSDGNFPLNPWLTPEQAGTGETPRSLWKEVIRRQRELRFQLVSATGTKFGISVPPS